MKEALDQLMTISEEDYAKVKGLANAPAREFLLDRGVKETTET